jgi:hypothetical protein
MTEFARTLLRNYEEYVTRYSSANQQVQEAKRRSRDFRDAVTRGVGEQGEPVEMFLILPVQRLMRYKLLLSQVPMMMKMMMMMMKMMMMMMIALSLDQEQGLIICFPMLHPLVFGRFSTIPPTRTETSSEGWKRPSPRCVRQWTQSTTRYKFVPCHQALSTF